MNELEFYKEAIYKKAKSIEGLAKKKTWQGIKNVLKQLHGAGWEDKLKKRMGGSRDYIPPNTPYYSRVVRDESLRKPRKVESALGRYRPDSAMSQPLKKDPRASLKQMNIGSYIAKHYNHKGLKSFTKEKIDIQKKHHASLEQSNLFQDNPLNYRNYIR